MSDDIIDLEARRRRRAATERALTEEAAVDAQEPRAAWLAPLSWCVRCPHCEFAIAIPFEEIDECDTAMHFAPANTRRFVICGACGLRDIRVGPVSILCERIEP